MKEISTLQNLLKESVNNCKSNFLALSGGIDSTILASLLEKRKVKGITIIAKDFIASDLTYCQLAAKTFGVDLKIKTAETNELLEAIEETIKILKMFNDIEIRNSVVIYLVLQELKKLNQNQIITGDGADELFAGYNFLKNKSEEDIAKDLERILNIMHFPSIDIGKALGITIETPFLDKKIIEFAKSLPVSSKIGKNEDKKYGKFILRKAFEDKIPRQIIWRDKAAMQDGSGTSGLTNLFESIITDDKFEEEKKSIQETDDVIIRSKESLHYYKIYRKYYKMDRNSDQSTKCPYCKFTIHDSKFCRMCGAFPV
ncbi:MAG: asparagine synthase [Crenarchaeota archaeon]|nr:MAG: asparagine synthase [Thermoproteota archaeon]RDJ34240.1 MAG: asparagine synthase [Thermoproteota archaeon]RDJ36647.1 MAG: asparagine synthase [Thermoproteota archaeon]RDJ37823.1 MAG: asparagine synthase [Thermoproteota archaeon]